MLRLNDLILRCTAYFSFTNARQHTYWCNPFLYCHILHGHHWHYHRHYRDNLCNSGMVHTCTIGLISPALATYTLPVITLLTLHMIMPQTCDYIARSTWELLITICTGINRLFCGNHDGPIIVDGILYQDNGFYRSSQTTVPVAIYTNQCEGRAEAIPVVNATYVQ